MQFDSDSKKKPYAPPSITKLSIELARRFVATNCSDQEATDFLESLRREQHQQHEK